MPFKNMATKIIDIRIDTAESDILADIKKGLRPENGGEKKLPTLLLYDQEGLRLFEEITYQEEYYLTNAEIEVLETYADSIAERISSPSIIVELGSGNLRKVNILLQALDRLGKDVEYYAVDLSLPELERTFGQIPTEGYKHVKCFGLHGTYDDALEWLKSPAIEAKPKTILWLGSSLGNFKRHEVPPFLAGFGEVLQTGDTMLIGIDSCKDAERVFHAYNDRNGVTHRFILNGLKHANALMGENTFNMDDWEAIGEYDKQAGRHHAFVAPRKDVVIDGVPVKKGERIRIEESYKYSREEAKDLWEMAKLAENVVWPNAKGDYGLHFVSKPAFFFPTKPEEYAANPVPSLSEWKELWKAWDAVSKQMIPEEELLSKPIKLRNECIFYLGHIPTFLDIHIARATDNKPSDPAYFWKIFERGVDPDVEDPTRCHAHSEVPEEWPPLKTILKFQQSVRDNVEALYSSGEAKSNGRVSRALWLGFEHEAMHLETLLYMLIQSDKVLPPPGTTVPDFAAFAARSNSLAVENEWFTIPASDISVGLEDPEGDYGSQRYFGWDNERPRRSTHVKSFRAKARPITNGEYATYLSKTGKTEIPASWCEQPYYNAKATGTPKRDSVINGHQNGTNGSTTSITEGKFVRTVFGTVPLKLALNWPVVASYDELAGCARWMGGRIPTMEEARSIYSYVESMKEEFEKSLGNTIPAVNGHLINEGVFETPPSKPLSNGNSGAVPSLNPHDLFIDLEGTNVGFKHWHPVSVAERGDKLCGQSDLGGVWEWTSTVLEKHDGFEPMELYPGYTADFFDGKHNMTLGGSWATHPRIAGRKTFVNWYQRNYPYVWAGARIVSDV
ncbi:Methyltransf 33 multi-domain protein [Pyrenophora teres f. maculata]|nr:Methyltransf 33 multi-domain protein [Pyrenophora teres f. maculata]